MIENCPMCNSVLVRKDANHYCKNEHCPSRKIESLIHFSSRDAMYIEGFGESIVEDFYNLGYLKNIDDFYILDKYKDELMLLEGFGEKSISKLLESASNSKKNSLERLLFGLGIKEIGSKTAKLLASTYENMDNLMNASTQDLESVRDIGHITALSVYEYLQNNKELIEKLKENLNNGIPARAVECNEDEQELVKDMFLLTSKPIIYIANISEEQIQTADDEEMVKQVKEYAAKEHAEVIPLCVKIEEELSGLDDSDKKEMLDALGLEESGLDKVIKRSYDLLGLMSFLTAGEPEVRAWTIKKGTKAPQAAGKIHSDIERGFIKAEVVSFDDLISSGGMVQAKEKGLVRQEGKEYIMQDGDIVLFKFNV